LNKSVGGNEEQSPENRGKAGPSRKYGNEADALVDIQRKGKEHNILRKRAQTSIGGIR
jgi:hypothetical protein